MKELKYEQTSLNDVVTDGNGLGHQSIADVCL